MGTLRTQKIHEHQKEYCLLFVWFCLLLMDQKTCPPLQPPFPPVILYYVVWMMRHLPSTMPNGLNFCQEVNCSSSEAWGHAACGTYPDTTWQQPIGQRQSDKHHHTAKHLQDRRHAAISVWPVQVVEACWSLVLLFCRIAPPTWLVKQKQASLILMQLVSICNMYQLVTVLAISMSDYWVTKCY